MGRIVPSAFRVLHVGIFVVWFTAVLVAQRLVGNANRNDVWKVVLKGAPDWMRYMVYVFSNYEFVNFMISMGQASSGGRHTTTSAADWRGFSGLWRVFYSAALLAILYSAAKTTESSPRCANGIWHRRTRSTAPGAISLCREFGKLGDGTRWKLPDSRPA